MPARGFSCANSLWMAVLCVSVGMPCVGQETAPGPSGARSVALGGQEGDSPVEREEFVLPGGKEIRLAVGGYIQANAEIGDVSAFEGRLPGGPKPIADRIRLRRGRLNVTGTLPEDLEFKMEGGFEQGDGIETGRTGFSATDVFVHWKAAPEAGIKVGQWKAPFGLEQTTPDTVLDTAERSLVTGALTPERQIGVAVVGKPLSHTVPAWRNRVSYVVGVFNGNGRNTSVNDNDDFLYAGRLEATPYEDSLFGEPASWKVGMNVFRSRDAADVNLSQTGNLKLQPDGSLLPFDDHSPDERRAFGADQSLRVGRFDFLAEYLRMEVLPTTASPDFDAFTADGYYLQGGCYLVEGTLQAALKYESFDPGQAPDDDLRSLTLGLNYYVDEHDLKIMLDWIHTWSEFRNENSVAGDDQFNEILARLQILF